MAEQLDQQLPATKNLHESLTRAEELAIKRKHAIVGLDHLLLALGQDPEAVAVLLVCNVDVEALCRDLLRKLGPEARLRNPNTVPPTFDVTVQNLIAHASAAALQAGHTEIDGANILSAIISGEGGMITHKILQKHGLTYNETVFNLENKNEDRNKEPSSDAEASPKSESKEKAVDQDESYNIVPDTPAVEVTSKDRSEAEISKQKSGPDTKAQRPQENLAQAKAKDDTIVQAEARPEDYGLTVEGREYHPVPPKPGQQPSQEPPAGRIMTQQPGQPPHPAQRAIQPGQQQGMRPPQGLPPRSPHGQPPQGQPHQGQHMPPHQQIKQGLGQAQDEVQGEAGAQHPQNRKVSFKDNANPAGKSHELASQNPEQRSQEASKFIQEDKYGSVPPTPPAPQDEVEKQRKETKDNLPPLSQKPAFLKEASAHGAENKRDGSHPLQGQPPLNPLQKNIHGAPQNLPPQQRDGQGGALNQQLIQQQSLPPQNLPPLDVRQKGAQGNPQSVDQQSLAQTQMKMDDIAGTIAQSQKAHEFINDQDQVVENIPKVMRVGKVHYLEVRVARFTNTEIELAPEDYGLRSKQNATPITKAITVRLTGPDGLFLIDCATASTQWTEMQGGMTNDADYAVWRWRVMPRKSGVSKLRLDITARTSNEDGLTAEIPIQPSKSIDVKVTKNYGSIFKKALILAAVLGIGYGIAQYGQQAYELVDDSIKEFSRKD